MPNRGANAFAIDEWGGSVTLYPCAVNYGRVWLEALKICNQRYDISLFLAEDHKRRHNWLKAQESECKTDEGGDESEGGEDLHRIKRNANVLFPVAYQAVMTTIDTQEALTKPNVQFYRCTDLVCGWQVWDNLDIISTRACAEEFRDAILEWRLIDYAYSISENCIRWRTVCARLNAEHGGDKSELQDDKSEDELDDESERSANHMDYNFAEQEALDRNRSGFNSSKSSSQGPESNTHDHSLFNQVLFCPIQHVGHSNHARKR